MIDTYIEPSVVRIIIADDNRSHCDAIAEYAADEPGFAFLGSVYDGISAVEACRELQPDVLLLDLVLPKLDGMGVLEALKDLSKRPKVLMFTAFGHESLIQQALALGADYYIMKPFDIDTLFTRIRQLVQPQSNGAGILHEQRWAIVEEQASKLMVELGIPPHFKGFAYLKDAIGIVVQDPELVSQITTRLYPMIAQRYRTTAAKVERAIRHAIERAWTKGEIKMNYELFAYSIDIAKGKPTNSLFIARIADHIRLQLRTP